MYRHIQYNGSQFSMAVNFLKQHTGQVSPVSLDIGADDLLPDYARATCGVKASFQQDLARVDIDLTKTILPQLVQTLTNSHGQRTGDLVLMNYYNPFANECGDSTRFIAELNQHLANDAAQFQLPLANVFRAFGGGTLLTPSFARRPGFVAPPTASSGLRTSTPLLRATTSSLRVSPM
jgi:hypothetical protein